MLVVSCRYQLHLVGGNSRFLAEFSQCCGLCVLARLDSTLWHLPRLGRRIEALADKDLALAVEQHDARAWTIGQSGEIGRGHRHPAASAMTRSPSASTITPFSAARAPASPPVLAGDARRRCATPWRLPPP